MSRTRSHIRPFFQIIPLLSLVVLCGCGLLRSDDGPISVTLRTDQDVYEHSVDIQMSLVVKNISDESQFYEFRWGHYPFFEVISDHGQVLYRQIHDFDLIRDNYVHEIKPGETWILDHTFPLGVVPGNYVARGYLAARSRTELADSQFGVMASHRIKAIPFQGESPTIATLTTDRATYAPGDTIRMLLRIHNPTSTAVEFHFPDTQMYEFEITNSKGQRIWLWSERLSFIFIMCTEILQPGETWEFVVEYDWLWDEGYYAVYSWLAYPNHRMWARTIIRISD
jgi:hypothetical protein